MPRSFEPLHRGEVARRLPFLVVFGLLLACGLSHPPAAVAQITPNNCTAGIVSGVVTCTGNFTSGSSSPNVNNSTGAAASTITPAIGFGPNYTISSLQNRTLP